MDQEAFNRQVRDALDHLQNRGFLATHPLASWFRPGGGVTSGDALRRALLDAIEQLRPMAGGASLDADWRRYRHLVLRHVEGQSLDSISRTLGVSVRQASRDYQQAVAGVASLLQIRDGNSGSRIGGGPSQPALREPAPDADGIDLSTTGEPTTHVEERRTGLVAAIDGAFETLEALASERGVTFEVSASDTLPPVAIGRTMLRQALLHLLTYAVEVGVGRIRLTATDTTRGIILRVAAETPRSTETDSSDDALSRRGELLRIGRHLLEEPGGTVELGQAQPDEGRGSFELFVAVFPPVLLSKVLVVDDNPDVVALFRRFLHDQPYRLFQATSALSASRIALDLRPDVIILDVVIPAQDGWDILRQLRSQPTLRDTPVVVCSVLPEQALAMSLGVADFLAKPVTRDRLITMLQRHGSPQVAMR